MVGTHRLSRQAALIRAWWLYVSFGNNLWHPVRTVLVSDTVWWIGVFNAWAICERPPQRFPLLSGAVFQADPSRLQILVSDTAGDDGMGYYFGALGSDAPEYRAAPWDARYSFVSSHAGELSALDYFLHRTQISNCLLLWATDSESGMHSVNSGVCKAASLFWSPPWRSAMLARLYCSRSGFPVSTTA